MFSELIPSLIPSFVFQVNSESKSSMTCTDEKNIIIIKQSVKRMWIKFQAKKGSQLDFFLMSEVDKFEYEEI